MKVMKRRRNAVMLSLLTTLVLAAAFAAPAGAALERVGPVNPSNGGYPAWYQDGTGLALEFCNPLNQAELNEGWCLILPADVPSGTAPETFPTDYSGEHFYWNATAGARGAGAVLVLSLEAAFNTADPVAGEQVVFGRLRITIPSLPASGDYKVYTPFGDFDFPGLVSGERLFFTTDIGIACGADFSCALNSNIGPFLLPSDSPGGAEVAAVPGPVTGKLYIADPARLGPVTGSSLPPFTSPADGLQYDHNRFRIELNGSTLIFDEPNFTLAGRVMNGTIPGRVSIDRASYSRTATGTKLDVFATAFPTIQGRLPAGSLLPAINPDLGFYDAPCATDPNTGAVTGPPTGTGLLYYQMLQGANHNWWGQNAPAVVPPQVCVQDLNARDANQNVIGAYFLGNVTDEVDITVADWDPTVNGGTMRVAAISSEQVDPPALTVAGFGVVDPGTGELLVSDLAAPPAKVAVTSTRGGVAVLDIRTGIGIPVSTITPVANADSATTPENAPISNINVLANDTLAGHPLQPKDNALVTITAQGRLGTATLNADYTINYTPNAGLSGTDIVGYTVTVTDVQGVLHTSNEGYLTIVITPINDIPVANNDTASTAINLSIAINVLANDTDPDGQPDLANAVIASVPGTGATLTCNGLDTVPATASTVCTGGLVTFSPTAGGIYTFTYYSQDKAGALSATPATVTVTVVSEQQVVITAAQFKGGGTQEWRVDGTATPTSQTNTITVTLFSSTGVNKGIVGTATADALGVWGIRLKAAGLLAAVNGDRVVATSSITTFRSSLPFTVTIK